MGGRGASHNLSTSQHVIQITKKAAYSMKEGGGYRVDAASLPPMPQNLQQEVPEGSREAGAQTGQATPHQITTLLSRFQNFLSHTEHGLGVLPHHCLQRGWNWDATQQDHIAGV